MIMAVEAQQHLKDCLFHGVCKHIHDSVWYSYSAADTTYSQLMVDIRKAESKNEETWEQVRARTMVTSNLGEGTAELSQQIVKLMATLTHTRQGSRPSVSQAVLGNVAADGSTMAGLPPVIQTPTKVWQAWPDNPILQPIH